MRRLVRASELADETVADFKRNAILAEADRVVSMEEVKEYGA